MMSEESLDLTARQVMLEEEAFETSLDKYERYFSKAIENGSVAESKEVIIIIKVMLDSLSSYIEEYYNLPLRGRNRDSQLLLKEVLPSPRDLAFFLLTGVLAPLFKGKQKILSVAKIIVNNLKQNKKVLDLEKQAPKLYSYIVRTNDKQGTGTLKKQLIRTARRIVEEESTTQATLGANCISLILNSGCGLIDSSKEGTTNYISFSSQTKELIIRSKVFFGSFVTTYYPLIVEPKPWEGIEGSGGYFTYANIPFIKTRHKSDLKYILEKEVDLSRFFEVVNHISNTGYKINKRILNTINTIIKHRLVDARTTLTNPCLYGDIPYMDLMVTNNLIIKEEYGEIREDGKFTLKEDKNKWLNAIRAQEDRIKSIESRRLQYRLALQIAEKFKEYKEIFFSYQGDFRSRLYPIQQFLNPQTSSNVKPLLEFSTGQVLNEEGLYWLKVHGANCYGYDKLVFDERVSKIDSMISDIQKIALDPIGNLKLWYGADIPLQYLAFCYSLNDYLQDPMALIYTAIPLDATCSGLQIYSGLLKDAKGAECVNVINKSIEGVADIYADVALLVNKYLLTDNYPKEFTYKTKDKISHTLSTVREALSISTKIDRKLTKRNVMTTPYSVTSRGMYDQVYNILTEYEDNNKKFWEGEKFVVAFLIATLNARAIAETVKSAHIGQQSIKAILRARLDENKEVYWQTPFFNFPILQRIFREKKETLRTPLGRLVIYHPTTKVHYVRMLNGIAPNFIHSLDATLLYRTVELCKEKGVKSFWLIHDSFAVSPNDVSILNESFREAYIELFEANPLLAWAEQLVNNANELVNTVMVGDLDLKEVINSKYIIC